MDQLFGDATTAMPTPAQHAEVESLMARSPIPSLDIRGRPGNFGADSSIPGLNINPPNGDAESSKGKLPATQSRSEGIGGWISRMVNRGKGGGKGGSREVGVYRRLGQDED